MLGWAAKKVNCNAAQRIGAIAASRTRLWLVSGRGCRGRRLSRERGSRCRRRALPMRRSHYRFVALPVKMFLHHRDDEVGV